MTYCSTPNSFEEWRGKNGSVKHPKCIIDANALALEVKDYSNDSPQFWMIQIPYYGTKSTYLQKLLQYPSYHNHGSVKNRSLQ